MPKPTFRIFVSSPGDVAAERQRTAQVIERLNGEFAGRVRLEAVLWEDYAYSAHAGFQPQIPEAADFDLVITIYWDARARSFDASHGHGIASNLKCRAWLTLLHSDLTDRCQPTFLNMLVRRTPLLAFISPKADVGSVGST